jgi:hypothetical protein
MTDEMPENIKRLVESGYRRVSYRHGTIARIDRPDWQQALAAYLGCQLSAIHKIRQTRPGELEDYYRRVLSKDCMRLSAAEVVWVPTSSFSDTGFIDPPSQTNDEQTPVP